MVKKYKFTLRHLPSFNSIVYPKLCPGCLAKTTDSYLQLRDEAGVPFILTVTLYQKWPICDKCADFIKLKIKLQNKYMYILFFSIVALFCLSVVMATNDILISPIHSLCFGFISPSFYFLGLPFFTRYLDRKAKSLGLQFSHEPIKLSRSAKMLFQDGYLVEFDCYFYDYAIAFYKLNHEVCDLKVSPNF